MALHRGIQSAVFYYLSCAPCAEARYRKQRKEERIRGRIERQLLQDEIPNLYRQPSPSSTNPHWQTDIALGPAFAGRGRRKPNATDNRHARKTDEVSDNASAEPSSIDLPQRAPSDNEDDSRWNFRLYQREDEELWGSASNVDAASSYAGSLAKPQRALTKDSHPTSYQGYRNPAINDMHPATVTKINSREEVMWMLQPPPVAEVMQGKERVGSRSRSDSGGSRMMNSSSVSLSRQLSARAVQNRLKSIESATSMSRESSIRTRDGPYGQRHDRSTTTSQRDFALSPSSLDGRELQMPSPVQLPQDLESSAVPNVPHFLAPDSAIKTQPRRIASRPQLPTIGSNSDVSFKQQYVHDGTLHGNAKENEFPARSQSSGGTSQERDRDIGRSAVLVSDGSPKLTSDAIPRSLNGQIIRTTSAPDVEDGSVRVSGHEHEPSEDGLTSVRPELLETWQTPDFELGEWVHETTKREVRQRWSMDL